MFEFTRLVNVIYYLDLHLGVLTQFSKLVRTWEAGVGTHITPFCYFLLMIEHTVYQRNHMYSNVVNWGKAFSNISKVNYLYFMNFMNSFKHKRYKDFLHA